MTLRDSLIGLVDNVRQSVLVDGTGLRFRVVQVRLRTYEGDEPGGDYVDELTPLTPRPRVRDPDPRLVESSGGTYLDGDRIVDRISAAYTQAELDGGDLEPAQLWHWLIDDVEYTLVQLEKRTFEWRAHLRPLRGR